MQKKKLFTYYLQITNVKNDLFAINGFSGWFVEVADIKFDGIPFY